MGRIGRTYPRFQAPTAEPAGARERAARRGRRAITAAAVAAALGLIGWLLAGDRFLPL